MNAGGTAERVYHELKRRILEREFRPGDRLDPAILCETLSSSVTPVRDCLNTLRGEGLVETRISEGFHLPQIDGPGLQDLYDWNHTIVGIAIGAWRQAGSTSDPGRPISPEPLALVGATAELFALIGARSINVEHRRAMGSVNDRLHAVRLAETKVLDRIWEEVAALRQLVAGDDRKALRKGLVAYHRRRRRASDDIVRTLYRNGGRR